MNPSRRMQPYRAGQGFREPGEALYNMLRGGTVYGQNPQNTTRQTQQQGALLRSLLRR